MLFNIGIDSIGFDPQRFAMDYHIIGFRECASEVARYLVTIEGMDIQDPLRLRLMSHLQCFVAQRELSAKSSTGVAASNWPSTGYQPNYPSQSYQTYPTAPITPHQQHHNQSQTTFNSSYMSTPSSSYLSSTVTPQSPEYSSSGYGTSASSAVNNSSSTAANVSSSINASTTTTSPVPNQTSTSDQSQDAQQQQQPIYTDLSNSSDRSMLNVSGNYHNYGNTNQLYGGGPNVGYSSNNNNNNNSKPYRPWHPEMAY